ncbi:MULTISPECIES: hypothetical protein [unclassified Streptomyces]|uniref:hypothetical protein n=1 Tax=unclassified Streptomyces TaxID=2593676 RepID=UPI0034135E19
MKRSPRPPTGPAGSFLGIYLNDHLTGANAGVALLRRAARAHRGGPFGASLVSLAEDVAQDRASLRALMDALGVPVLRTRAVAGRIAERAGLLRFNGRLLSRSPLSDVMELEAMLVGVEGKAACWRSLRSLAGTDPRLDVALLDELIRRAERQARTLEALRSACAVQLFTREAPDRTAARHSPALG